MRLTVNCKPQNYEDDPDMPLLWYLRDDLRLTGTRFGCGAGLCGACTVHVNGQAVRSCQTRMGTLDSKTVLTIDALGRVVDAEVVVPSQSKVLDRRALAIVKAAAPFGVFTSAMRREADLIEVTSRFTFAGEDGLKATLMERAR